MNNIEPANSSKSRALILKKVGANLKLIREDKKIEVKQIAAWLDLSQQAYLNMENGKTDFSLTRIVDLVNHLGIDLDELLGIQSKSIFFHTDENTVKLPHDTKSNLNKKLKADEIPRVLQEKLAFLQAQIDQLTTMMQ
ncbi:MAG: helix-turn-helix transcriptional regulator [Chitinophagaceae bacterium]